jgi:hypothetical protein
MALAAAGGGLCPEMVARPSSPRVPGGVTRLQGWGILCSIVGCGAGGHLSDKAPAVHTDSLDGPDARQRASEWRRACLLVLATVRTRQLPDRIDPVVPVKPETGQWPLITPYWIQVKAQVAVGGLAACPYFPGSALTSIETFHFTHMAE